MGKKFSKAVEEKTKKKVGEERFEDLVQIISLLDGIRAFRRTDPEKIEQHFKNLKSKELSKEWGKIKRDVEKIVYLPQKIPGAIKYMQTTAVLKMVYPLIVGLLLVAIGASLRRSFFKSEILKFLSSFPFVTTMVILSVALANIYVFFDYRLRKKIVRYEESHKEKFAMGRRRIKTVIQKTINILNRELMKTDYPRENYKITLFFSDYEGLEIKPKKKGLFSKRKYELFEGIPSVEAPQ